MSAKKINARRETPAKPEADTVLCSDGQHYREIRDEHFMSIAERLNSTIHECVFALSHAEDNEIADAQNALTTALGNLSGIQEELDALRVEREDQP